MDASLAKSLSVVDLIGSSGLCPPDDLTLPQSHGSPTEEAGCTWPPAPSSHWIPRSRAPLWFLLGARAPLLFQNVYSPLPSDREENLEVFLNKQFKPQNVPAPKPRAFFWGKDAI